VWLGTTQTLGEIARTGSAKQKKDLLLKIFGSNLFLDSKKARGCNAKPWSTHSRK
jgi:hypothetical protein